MTRAAARNQTYAEDIGLKMRSIATITLAIHARIPELALPPAEVPVTPASFLVPDGEGQSIPRTFLLVVKWIALAGTVAAPWVLLLTS